MKKCKPGQYYCYTDKKCKPIPRGFKIVGRVTVIFAKKMVTLLTMNQKMVTALEMVMEMVMVMEMGTVEMVEMVMVVV